MRALDRYTMQFKLEEPNPALCRDDGRYTACTARSRAKSSRCTATYSGASGRHRARFGLVEWRRSSRIVLERNPTFRDVLYDADPNADDAEGQALLQSLKGRACR